MKESKYLPAFKRRGDSGLRPGLMYVEVQAMNEVDEISVGGKTLYRPTDLKDHKLAYKDKVLNHVIVLEVGGVEDALYKPGDIVQIPMAKLNTYSKFGALQPYVEESIALTQEDDVVEYIGSLEDYNETFRRMNEE